MCRAVCLTGSTGQEIHRSLSNIAADNGDIRIHIDQIKFSQRKQVISMMSILILFLSIFKHNSAALYAHSNISATYFFCTITHKTVYISN